MRRLTKNVRDDGYSSSRDYQDIIKEESTCYQLNEERQIKIILDNTENDTEFIGIGGYIKVDQETQLKCSVYDDSRNEITTKNIKLPEHWKRFGVGWVNGHSTTYEVNLFVDVNQIFLYALTFSGFDRPLESDLETEELLERLNKAHMAPESYYLNSKQDVVIKGIESISHINSDINLKKCSYCQRYLLVGQNDSSFHKHKSKKSGYQNECRSCKALRINDALNQLRTVDQLNESSVITREKKILLREPEILLEIKNRHSGEGLKSLTWKKFNKRCFKCDKKLLLREVQLDHTRPLAYLWPLDEFATCLCEGCNNSKHDKFPIDFYNESELKSLSGIIGLSLEELKAKDVNEEELSNIINDIELYFDELDRKTFKSIRNKVIELRQEIDLYELLKNNCEERHQKMQKFLTERNHDKE